MCIRDRITAIGTYVAPAKDTAGSGSSGGSSSGGSSSGGNSEASGSTQFGDVNAEGKLVSVPTIAQIHTGNLYAVSYTHLDVYKRQVQHHLCPSSEV